MSSAALIIWYVLGGIPLFALLFVWTTLKILKEDIKLADFILICFLSGIPLIRELLAVLLLTHNLTNCVIFKAKDF